MRFRRADGTLFDGVASFGRRPTVDSNGAPLLETFVFDFSGDLYGETCTVSFFEHLRDELKFDGLEALVVQMKRDEEEARALLSGVRPARRRRTGCSVSDQRRRRRRRMRSVSCSRSSGALLGMQRIDQDVHGFRHDGATAPARASRTLVEPLRPPPCVDVAS